MVATEGGVRRKQNMKHLFPIVVMGVLLLLVFASKYEAHLWRKNAKEAITTAEIWKANSDRFEKAAEDANALVKKAVDFAQGKSVGAFEAFTEIAGKQGMSNFSATFELDDGRYPGKRLGYIVTNDKVLGPFILERHIRKSGTDSEL